MSEQDYRLKSTYKIKIKLMNLKIKMKMMFARKFLRTTTDIFMNNVTSHWRT